MGTTFKRLMANMTIGPKKALSKKQADFLEKNSLRVPFSRFQASKIISEFKEKSNQRDWFVEQKVQEQLRSEKLRMAKIETEMLMEKRRKMEEELKRLREKNEKEKGAGKEIGR